MNKCIARLMNLVTFGAVPLRQAYLPSSEQARAQICADLSLRIYQQSISELISNQKTDAQACVHLNTDQGTIVVFRGSESRTDWTLNIVYRYRGDLDTTNFPGVNCHSGVKMQWESVEYQVVEALKKHDKRLPVMVTGHSLGGALATIAALQLTFDGYSVYLFTFGSPRVVNRAGVRLFEQLEIPRFRFRNGADLVTSIPLINFRHVSDPIVIGPERSPFYAWSIADHMPEQYAINVRALSSGT